MLEHVAQRCNQRVIQGVALGRAAQVHQGHRPSHLQKDAVGGGVVKYRVAVSGHAQGFQNGGLVAFYVI
jgi:hypothetical protein